MWAATVGRCVSIRRYRKVHSVSASERHGTKTNTLVGDRSFPVTDHVTTNLRVTRRDNTNTAGRGFRSDRFAFDTDRWHYRLYLFIDRIQWSALRLCRRHWGGRSTTVLNHFNDDRARLICLVFSKSVGLVGGKVTIYAWWTVVSSVNIARRATWTPTADTYPKRRDEGECACSQFACRPKIGHVCGSREFLVIYCMRLCDQYTGRNVPQLECSRCDGYSLNTTIIAGFKQRPEGPAVTDFAGCNDSGGARPLEFFGVINNSIPNYKWDISPGRYLRQVSSPGKIVPASSSRPRVPRVPPLPHLSKCLRDTNMWVWSSLGTIWSTRDKPFQKS